MTIIKNMILILLKRFLNDIGMTLVCSYSLSEPSMLKVPFFVQQTLGPRLK